MLLTGSFSDDILFLTLDADKLLLQASFLLQNCILLSQQ